MVVILSLGVLISAAYAIRTIGRLFTGPVQCEIQQITDLRKTEMLAASVLTAGFLIIGFFPAPMLNIISVSLNELSNVFASRL